MQGFSTAKSTDLKLYRNTMFLQPIKYAHAWAFLATRFDRGVTKWYIKNRTCGELYDTTLAIMGRWVKRGSAQLPTSCHLPQAFGLWSPGRGCMDGVTTTKTVVSLKPKVCTLRCFVVNLATGSHFGIAPLPRVMQNGNSCEPFEFERYVRTPCCESFLSPKLGRWGYTPKRTRNAKMGFQTSLAQDTMVHIGS
jgi:hypothetical protein